MTFFLFCAHYWKKGDGHRGNVHGLALLLVWFHGFASHVLCICSFSFFVLLSFLGCSSMFSHLLGHLLSYYQKVSRWALHRNINSSHLCHKAPATCSGTRSWFIFYSSSVNFCESALQVLSDVVFWGMYVTGMSVFVLQQPIEMLKIFF